MNICLDEGNPITLTYHGLSLRICPIISYDGHNSNIRIFLSNGGGLRTRPDMYPRRSFKLRIADEDGAPTNFDTRIITACIELEATVQ